MRKWIEFNLSHPKSIMIVLVIVTFVSIFGISRLKFDSSTDVLMPKADPVYQMGERANLAFTDNKTFTITSIEAAKNKELFSHEVFSHIKDMVKELREYRDFDMDKENARLDKLISLGSVEIESQGEKKAMAPVQNDSLDSSLEKELDAELFGTDETVADDTAYTDEESPEDQSITTQMEADLDKEILGIESEAQEVQSIDLWDLSSKLKENRYPTPLRERNTYNYDNYSPVTLETLNKNLDTEAQKVLATVLYRNEIVQEKNEPLTKSEFESIVESFEDIYLFKSLRIIRNILDPISGEDIRGDANELKPVGLLKEVNGDYILPKTEEDFAKYKENLMRNPAFESGLYATNEKGEIIALGMNVIFRLQKKYDHFMEYFWSIVQKYNESPVKLYSMGSLIFNKFMNDNSKTDLGKFMPLVILIVVATFFLNFRSGRGLFLPSLTVIFATLWTVGLMGFLGIKMTIMTTILPPLLIAIGSSYSIHIFNQYLTDLHLLHEQGKARGLANAMSHISTTVFLAGFTTFIGFLTLLVNQVTALRDFGIFSAVGTFFAMFVAVSLIPSFLMLLKLLPLKEKPAGQETYHEGNWAVKNIVRFLSYFTLNYPKSIATIVILSLLVSGYGITRLTTETAPVTYFKDGSYVKTASLHIGEVFNGSMVLNIVFDSGQAGGARTPEFLKYIEQVRDWLDKPEQRLEFNMLHHTSFSDFIKRLHMAMNSDNPKFYKIPDKEITIRDYLEIFSGEDEDADGRPDSFESTVDNEYRRISLLVRLGDRGGKTVGTAMFRQARDHLKANIPKFNNPGEYTFKILGEPISLIILGSYIVQGQIQSLILSIFIVGLIVFLLFRNGLAGLSALIPISASVILVFGIMGYMGIPLDIAKAILSSIAIGIGVDDTIHFMNTLRKRLKAGDTLKEAIRATHKLAGVAIVYTSIALIFGFAVLMFSSFTPVFHFGLLVSMVMIATTFAALLMLPTFILLGNWQIHKENNWKWLKKLNLQKFLE